MRSIETLFSLKKSSIKFAKSTALKVLCCTFSCDDEAATAFVAVVTAEALASIVLLCSTALDGSSLKVASIFGSVAAVPLCVSSWYPDSILDLGFLFLLLIVL